MQAMDTNQIWTNIIAYALQIGLLIAIGAALPALLRFGGGKAPAARLLYWQVLLVACVALPWVRPWQSELIVVSRMPPTVLFTGSQPHPGVAVTPAIPSLAVIALWILGAGIVLRLFWLAAGMLKLARYRRNGHVLPLPPEWTGMAAETTLLISDDVSGPVTFGLRKPVVLLPSSFSTMPLAMRDAILFHELLHVERCDWLFTLGEEILRAVFWFHPAIWWVLGEVQLAREQTVDQAVIEMTQARDPYVDTLLAMAGVSAEMELAAAPSFLRRRHLKQRVLGIVQEGKVSKPRLILAEVAALSVMAAAVWFITAAVPMRAQAQTTSDDVGVTVTVNAPLMHRSPISYPGVARSKGIEGTVAVQVHLDANGEVTDDTILSGPDELRRGVQQSVLNWHFDKSVGSTTQVVNISFVKTPESTTPMVVTPAEPLLMAPTPNTLLRSMPAARPAQIFLNGRQTAVETTGKIDSIEVIGLSDTAKAQLLAQLPVHVGDTYSLDLARQVATAAHEFDEHLQIGSTIDASGGRTLTLRTGPSVFMPAPSITATIGAQKIGPNVAAANLIRPVTTPIYPPLAKLARQQGTVRFDATIGNDGKMAELKVISGPALLIQAATDAVKTWTYQPTYVSGQPVVVQTTIDVNFTLDGGDQ
jgi:TonB family protein